MTSTVWLRPNPTAVAFAVVAWGVMVAAHTWWAAETIVENPLVLWALMASAMMVPVAMPAVDHIAVNSLRRRRRRSIVTFLSAYLGVWVLFGVMALGLVLVWDRWAAGTSFGPLLPAISLLVAAGWQLSPARRRLMARCHKPVPLPASGWRATAGAIRFGFRYGVRCVAVCWAAMLVMVTVTTGHLLWTVLLTIVILGERSVRWLRQNNWAFSPVFATPAVLVLIAASTGDESDLLWFCTITGS